MPLLNATLAAAAAGRTPAFIILVEADFPDGFGRYWLGGTGIIQIDGHDWQGDANLTTVSAIGDGRNDSADMVEFGLSGVSPAVIALARQAGSVRGRDLTIYGQFLDENSPEPLDDKIVLKMLIMDTLGYGAAGPSQRSIRLTAETIWTARNTAAWAWYTDRDQQARFPDDMGMEFVPTLKFHKVAWPIYS